MKDWLFYPLVMAFVGTMVFYALSLADYENVDSRSGLVLEGRSLTTLYAAQGTSYSMAGDNINPFAYAVLSAHVSRKNAPASAGIFVTLGPEDLKIFQGKPLRITIHARKGRAAPLESFDFGYFSPGGRQTEWQTFELTDVFSNHEFEFTPGTTRAGVNDYVGIWPDVSGEARTMDVKWVKIEVIGAGD